MPSALYAVILDVFEQIAKKLPSLSKANPAAWMNWLSPSPYIYFINSIHPPCALFWQSVSKFLSRENFRKIKMTYVGAYFFANFAIQIAVPNTLVVFIHVGQKNCVAQASRKSNRVLFVAAARKSHGVWIDALISIIKIIKKIHKISKMFLEIFHPKSWSTTKYFYKIVHVAGFEPCRLSVRTARKNDFFKPLFIQFRLFLGYFRCFLTINRTKIAFYLFVANFKLF